MKKTTGLVLSLSMLFISCSHQVYIENPDRTTSVAFGWSKESKLEDTSSSGPQIMVKLPELKNERKAGVMPDATAFRMSGDYSGNVAVTLSPSGELLYFPAPTDITADSEPVELTDGWWLNNQGIGPNSVFTKYTFAEYAALPATPSVEQLKLSIIPGAKVTDFMQLPFKVGEASQNIDEIKNFIKDR